jgi:hypothetical protein
MIFFQGLFRKVCSEVCSGRFVLEGLFWKVSYGRLVLEGLFRKVCSGRFVPKEFLPSHLNLFVDALRVTTPGRPTG